MQEFHLQTWSATVGSTHHCVVHADKFEVASEDELYPCTLAAFRSICQHLAVSSHQLASQHLRMNLLPPSASTRSSVQAYDGSQAPSLPVCCIFGLSSLAMGGHGKSLCITRKYVTEFGATAGCNGCKRQVGIINGEPLAFRR